MSTNSPHIRCVAITRKCQRLFTKVSSEWVATTPPRLRQIAVSSANMLTFGQTYTATAAQLTVEAFASLLAWFYLVSIECGGTVIFESIM